MITLYSKQEAEKMRKRAAIGKTAAAGALFAALAACVALCFQVRTRNAQSLLILVIGLSVLGGWTAILLWFLLYRPSQAQYRHMTGILSGEAEERRGVLSISPVSFSIPQSITIRKATLDQGDETLTLNLNERFLSRLPRSFAPVRVLTVRKYITAVEEIHENP